MKQARSKQARLQEAHIMHVELATRYVEPMRFPDFLTAPNSVWYSSNRNSFIALYVAEPRGRPFIPTTTDPLHSTTTAAPTVKAMA